VISAESVNLYQKLTVDSNYLLKAYLYGKYVICVIIMQNGLFCKLDLVCKSTSHSENYSPDAFQYNNVKTFIKLKLNKTKLRGSSPRANYTDRATAACRRSKCQLMGMEGVSWSARRISTAIFSDF
jgi:hypothetical protein